MKLSINKNKSNVDLLNVQLVHYRSIFCCIAMHGYGESVTHVQLMLCGGVCGWVEHILHNNIDITDYVEIIVNKIYDQDQ